MVTYSGLYGRLLQDTLRPTHRDLLDELFREDGQSLGALEARFGIVKHLKLLEEAGLAVTRRRGRQKLHFLNQVPIRLIHDRWLIKYALPWIWSLPRPRWGSPARVARWSCLKGRRGA